MNGVKPWIQSPLGQHGFYSVRMTVCLIVKRMYQLSYNKIIDCLPELSTLLKALSLKKVSSRSKLQNVFSKISKNFSHV